jgi:hypothetical protein
VLVEVGKTFMRYFGYLYHGLLALFLLAVSGMALATGIHSLHLDMLPWTGASLTYWVFFGALFGLLTVVLAMKRIAPVLFFLWALVVFALMLKGYVFSGYYFESGEFKRTVYLLLGAIVALLGAWFAVARRPARA